MYQKICKICITCYLVILNYVIPRNESREFNRSKYIVIEIKI